MIVSQLVHNSKFPGSEPFARYGCTTNGQAQCHLAAQPHGEADFCSLQSPGKVLQSVKSESWSPWSPPCFVNLSDFLNLQWPHEPRWGISCMHHSVTWVACLGLYIQAKAACSAVPKLSGAPPWSNITAKCRQESKNIGNRWLCHIFQTDLVMEVEVITSTPTLQWVHTVQAPFSPHLTNASPASV